MKPVLCEVAELVQTALKFTEEDRSKLGFSTEVVLPEEPVYILGDRIALESVFQNLAQNVLRHAADGKYLGIFVSVEKKQSGKKSVIIKIRDKGPGISPWEQKTIFEPFVRGRRAIDNQIPGNGIGLNLVKRIVNVHEGTIVLESKSGVGSTFTIAFPENRGDTDVYQNSDDRR
jgi:signal transduction histidine kinase